MADVVRYWVDRGADGFRVDAVDRMVKDAELRDDPPSETRSRCRCRRSSGGSI